MTNTADTDAAWQNFIHNNFQLIDNIDKNNIIKKDNATKIPKPSEIYISTQTKIAFLNQKIDLITLFWKIPVISYQNRADGVIKKQIKINNETKEEINILEEQIKNEDNLVVVDIISQVDNPNARKIKFKDVRKINIGLCKKDLQSTRKKKKGAFYNCFVLIIRLNYKGIFKETHIKIFNTGKLEIPGIREDAHLLLVLDKLIEIIQPHLKSIISYEKEHISNVLINSNFSANFYIDRQKLYEILKNQYKIYAIFDSCSYPGIQCKFYFNKMNKENNGICKCPKRCTKKGKGSGVNECLEVSFMIFRTGSILIVGNCTIEILHIIYDFSDYSFEK